MTRSGELVLSIQVTPLHSSFIYHDYSWVIIGNYVSVTFVGGFYDCFACNKSMKNSPNASRRNACAINFFGEPKNCIALTNRCVQFMVSM